MDALNPAISDCLSQEVGFAPACNQSPVIGRSIVVNTFDRIALLECLTYYTFIQVHGADEASEQGAPSILIAPVNPELSLYSVSIQYADNGGRIWQVGIFLPLPSLLLLL